MLDVGCWSFKSKRNLNDREMYELIRNVNMPENHNISQVEFTGYGTGEF